MLGLPRLRSSWAGCDPGLRAAPLQEAAPALGRVSSTRGHARVCSPGSAWEPGRGRLGLAALRSSTVTLSPTTAKEPQHSVVFSALI